MKKYAVLYTNKYTKEQLWSFADDGTGASYALQRRVNTFPSRVEAKIFYTSDAIQQAEHRIKLDKQFSKMNFNGSHYDAEIIEFDAEPEGYSEFYWAIKHFFGDNVLKEVLKSFPLNKDIKYRIRPNCSRPWIFDLNMDELERYYNWRKKHYRGKVKQE